MNWARRWRIGAAAAVAVVIVTAVLAAVSAPSRLRGSRPEPPQASAQRPATARFVSSPRTHARPYTDTLATVAAALPTGWTASRHSIVVGGMNRSYFMAVPTNLTGRVPVVVLLHGRDMTPSGILRMSGVAGGIGPAIVVVPEGWEEFWNAGDCCGAAYLHHVDDVEFIAAVVHDVLAATPAADPSDVYAIGFSNGGRLAYHLACGLPGTFRGIMAVEAVPVQPCAAMAPTDVTVVAQQADPLLTVNAGQPPKKVGGFVEPTVAATVGDVRHLDGCSGAPTATVAGVAVEHTWSCRAGTVVRYVWYPGGAHTWRPATASTPGVTGFARQLLGRSDASRRAPT